MEDNNKITHVGIKAIIDTKINNIIKINLGIKRVIKAQIF